MLNTRIQDYLGITDKITMSLFRSFTPKFLYQETLSLVNVMFHCPPRIPTGESQSYFCRVLHIHNIIRTDLNEILSEESAPSGQTTIEQVHASLTKLEKQLFGSTTEFEKDIKGCCLHTRALEQRLSESQRCVLV